MSESERAHSDSRPNSSESPRSPDGSMSFFDHLAELRRRLLYCVIVIFVAALLCLSFSPQLFEVLRQPLADIPNQKLIVLSPLELYLTYLKLALLSAVFATWPFILLQFWLFVAPGLYAREKRWIAPLVILGSVFFFGGALFAFFVVLPAAFKYLVEMMPPTVESTYSVAVYFSLVIRLVLAFGAVFELPLVMWILSASGLVNPKIYSKIRGYWIVAAFVLAALLTPPDPLSQGMMVVPLLAFYEIGALGARMLFRRRKAAKDAPQAV